MIFRKYGTKYHSVVPNFDARAMTEVGFQRSGDEPIDADEFAAQYERIDGRELTATAEGSVQDEVERETLNRLLEQLRALESEVGPEAVLVVESEQGKDYPKTREKTTTKVEGLSNKLHFERTIDPPLRIGVYRKRGN